MQRKGFMLVELSIVLVLLTTLIMLASTQSTFLTRLLVRAQLETLCMTIRYVQQLAMTTNRDITITIDPPTNTYRYEDQVCTLPAQVRFGTIAGVKGPPSAPTHALTHPVTFKRNTITCYATGIIDAGVIYLVDQLHTYQYAISVSVAQVSYLRLYQYDTKWHLLI